MKTIKEHMLAASSWTPHFYEVIPAKAMVSFLSKLSEPYSSLFRIRGQEMSMEQPVGYDANMQISASNFDEMGEAL